MQEIAAYTEKLLQELEKISREYQNHALALLDAENLSGAQQAWRKTQGVNEAIEVVKRAWKQWKQANG